MVSSLARRYRIVSLRRVRVIHVTPYLSERVTAANIIFISAYYRLIPPSTGFDILEDIKDVFSFLRTQANDCLRLRLSQQTRPVFQIDSDRTAVAGNSAGGLCAYLAAMHVVPRPKAVLALYAMGGDFLVCPSQHTRGQLSHPRFTDVIVQIPHYMMPKDYVFFRGRELLDPMAFSEYLPPRSQELDTISDSPLAYHSADAPIPGYPANPRMLLARLYLQMGTFLDHWTGHHGLTVRLRDELTDLASPGALLNGEPPHIISDSVILFPQFGVDSAWPPCFLVHGAADTAVPVNRLERIFRPQTTSRRSAAVPRSGSPSP